MKKDIKDIFVLFLITVVAGCLLGFVNNITKEPIKRQHEEAKNKAYKAVMPDADRFEEMDVDYKLMLEGSDYYETCSVDSVIKAYKNDELLGYLITITDNEGYGGDITLVSAIKSDGTINGISILTINETAGLGMNAKKPEFYEQFAGRKVDKFVYTKSGAAKDSEIDAISSATITTNAVTNAVNASIVAYDYIKIVSLSDVNGGAN
ncbi:MAG: RnfABCDGE type electron transport complex subunit G [Lachnospiraceae bacterium]|nr:RnfABCDGE type electron transport complex subunit G [Lachnospiraceae bacterium]